jgi:hypothetical protein
MSDLRTAASRYQRAPLAKSLYEARAKKVDTAFLCHSHQDQDLAIGLQVVLAENGWNLYIDWQDTDLPEEPDRESASKIKLKIRELDWFLFLATDNSTRSRWCPWEIGYADSVKSHGAIMIIPTSDASGRWYGNEYLQLYRQVTEAQQGGLAAFGPGATSGGVFVKQL